MARFLVFCAVTMTITYGILAGCAAANAQRDVVQKGVEVSPDIRSDITASMPVAVKGYENNSKVVEMITRLQETVNTAAGRDSTMNSTTLLLGIGGFVTMGLAILSAAFVWGMSRIGSSIDKMDSHQQTREASQEKRFVRFLSSQRDILNAVHGLKGFKGVTPDWMDPELTPDGGETMAVRKSGSASA